MLGVQGSYARRRFDGPAHRWPLHSELCYNGIRLIAAQGNMPMIDLYYWTTPNGHKITIFLEKTGQFLSRDPRARIDAIQWLFWQMGNLGPMAGQNNHFSNYAQEKIPYAMDRYRNEVNRLYGVLNKRLADRAF